MPVGTRRSRRLLSGAQPPPPGRQALRASIRGVGVAVEVDHDGARENEDVVLAIGDVDAVTVGPGEVLLRDRRDLAAMARERIFVIEEAPRRLEVVRAGDIDGELAVDEGEHVLADHDDNLLAAHNLDSF